MAMTLPEDAESVSVHATPAAYDDVPAGCDKRAIDARPAPNVANVDAAANAPEVKGHASTAPAQGGTKATNATAPGDGPKLFCASWSVTEEAVVTHVLLGAAKENA
jgi:hypothetical protein